MLVKTIPLRSIVLRPHKDLRALDPEHVKRLAESIKEIGLQTPISLRIVPDEEGHDTGTYLLVAGLHRLYACSSLDWTEIPAVLMDIDDLDRDLWEIDENLIRAELTELERAVHLAKRKRLYEAKHQYTKHGGAPGKAGGGKKAKDPNLGSFAPAFVDDTAEKTGMSRTDIARSVHRAEAIAAEVKEAIHDMPEIADKGVELDALAAVEPEEQKAAVEAVKSGKARNVREATRGPKTRNRKPEAQPAPSDQEIVRREILAAVERCQKQITQRLAAVQIQCAQGAIEVEITFAEGAQEAA